jgi:hypothetical protein
MTEEADTGAERIATGPGHVTAVPGKIIQVKILTYLIPGCCGFEMTYFGSGSYPGDHPESDPKCN